MYKKVLGKISNFEFGVNGHNDLCLGYSITFSLEGGSMGVMTSEGFLDYEIVEHDNNCKWSEEDRDLEMVKMLKKLSKTLRLAKVKNVEDLVGIPVEVVLDTNNFKSWRVLVEVL